MSKALLVTGATGKQGKNVVDQLLKSPEASQFTIYALTRDTTSPSAQSLTKKYKGINLVQGNLDNCPAIFKSIPTQIWGVFSVQVTMGKGATPQTEETQGKALVDAALANKVSHFVYTSVDRHGENSINDPTYVPHFISKHNIEKYLIQKSDDGTKMTYTILRPVGFMENITPDFQGKVFPACINTLPRGCKLQLISCIDIGYFAAQSFIHPAEFNRRGISLAGDEIDHDALVKTFKREMGYNMPETFGFLAKGLLMMVTELKVMFKWFQEVGYDAKIGELRAEYPELLSWEDYLRKGASGFPKKR
ncbi:MAG: hypothetical protein MMC33_010183 [Icmadophila ericetorum]|nr:hypothetical protein [Icmadophila ericetorum]